MHSILDHIVLNVADMDRMLDFYVRIMQFHPERLEAYRAGTVGFPSVRLNETTIIDLFDAADDGARAATHNLNHFCIAVSETDFAALQSRLKDNGVTLDGPPGTRWGARGNATAISFPDPEGNVIEVRCYPGDSDI